MCSTWGRAGWSVRWIADGARCRTSPRPLAKAEGDSTLAGSPGSTGEPVLFPPRPTPAGACGTRALAGMRASGVQACRPARENSGSGLARSAGDAQDLPLPAPLGRPGPRILDASVRRYVRVPVARKRVAPPRKKSGSVWRAVRGCQEPALSLPRPASHPRPQCMGVSRIRAPGACKRTGSPRSRSGEQRTARPAGGNGGQSARLIQVALISVYLSKACRDLSRPLPDCL